MTVTSKNLDAKLQQAGNAVDMLRRSSATPDSLPIQAEFTNWRDEQEAWRTGAALFDQSHHMTDLYVEGPDAIRLLSALGVNSFKNFGCNRAKQLVACNSDGFVIADAVLFGLEPERFNIVGRPSMADWVEFHARTGGYDVVLHRDDRVSRNPFGRRVYRFEMQGPNVLDILRKINGGPLPEIRFFHLGDLVIAGRRVRALRRRGMCGAPGIEIWGPVADGPAVLDALMTAGAEFGLRRCGARAQSTFATESGWIASPLPAIYSGDTMKAYREWLSADSFDATASLGGSYCSMRIEDYYLTPWDLGNGHFVSSITISSAAMRLRYAPLSPIGGRCRCPGTATTSSGCSRACWVKATGRSTWKCRRPITRRSPMTPCCAMGKASASPPTSFTPQMAANGSRRRSSMKRLLNPAPR